MEEKWIPEQGEMVIIWETNKTNAMEREFISMTSKDDYLCWDEFKTYAYTWNEAQPVKKEPVYERRWKMLIDGERGYTDETVTYYNQKRIDSDWGDRYKGSFIDVLVEE